MEVREPKEPEPGLLTDEKLDQLRQHMDPVADAAVAAIYGPDRSAGHACSPLMAMNALLGDVVENADQVPRSLPPPARELLESDALVGSAAGGWDAAQLLAGARVFERYGLEISAVLHLLALPLTYSAGNGVQVLCFTDRMEHQTLRRILETGQLLVDTMSHEGLLESGRGRRTAQKVRLLHSSIRHLILASGRWNPAWGMPINQEDLLGTLMAFTVGVERGLRKLGIELTKAEADAYYYRWKAVAQLLGIPPALIPADLELANQTSELIARRQFRATPEGQRLTAALIRMMQDILPGTVFDGLVPVLMRQFLGDEYADLVAIPKATDHARTFGDATIFFRLGESLLSHTQLLRLLTSKLGSALTTAMLFFVRGPNRPGFQLPAALHQAWGIPNPAA